jgi:pyridoxamine 5'-phosphate oxidase
MSGAAAAGFSAPDPRIVFPVIPEHVEPLRMAAAPGNPLQLLQRWIDHVLSIGAREPMYVTLATASATGSPSSRTVQLLEVESDALRFTTNFGSRKGIEMRETGRAAVSMYWRETAQSVNLTGTVVESDDDECERLFAAEHRAVQASRVVSFHGRRLEDERAQLAAFRALVAAAEPIARPDYWRYFRLVPDSVTFWEGHSDALNRRLHYAREDGVWEHFAIEA